MSRIALLWSFIVVLHVQSEVPSVSFPSTDRRRDKNGKMEWGFVLTGSKADKMINVQVVNAAFPGNPECGEAMGCYPVSCPEVGCDFQLTWMDNGTHVAFSMSYEVSFGNKWIAVGFSKNNRMPDTSVVMCKLDAESEVITVEVGHTATSGYAYNSLETNYGIQNIATNFSNGTMFCAFERMKYPSLDMNMLFPLNETTWLLHATGSTLSGVPSRHSQREVSLGTVDFLTFGTTEGPLTTPSMEPTMPMTTATTTKPSSASVSTASQLCCLITLAFCMFF